MAAAEEEPPAITLLVHPARGDEKQCADAATDFLRARTRDKDQAVVHPYCSPGQLVEAIQKAVSCRRKGRIRVEFHEDATLGGDSAPAEFLLHGDLPVAVEELDRLFGEFETALTRVDGRWAYDITKPPQPEEDDSEDDSEYDSEDDSEDHSEYHSERSEYEDGFDSEGEGEAQKPARLVGSCGSVMHLEASWTLRGLKYETSFPVLSFVQSGCDHCCGVENTATVRAEAVDGEVRVTHEEGGFTTIAHLCVPPRADLATLAAWTGEAVVHHVDAPKHRRMSRSLEDAVSSGDAQRVTSAVSALRAWASGRPGGLERPGWSLGAFSDVLGRAQLLGGEVWRAIFEGMDPDRASVLHASHSSKGCVRVPWSWVIGGDWTAIDPRRKPTDESVCAVRSELAARFDLADAAPGADSSYRAPGVKEPQERKHNNLKHLIELGDTWFAPGTL